MSMNSQYPNTEKSQSFENAVPTELLVPVDTSHHRTWNRIKFAMFAAVVLAGLGYIRQVSSAAPDRLGDTTPLANVPQPDDPPPYNLELSRRQIAAVREQSVDRILHDRQEAVVPDRDTTSNANTDSSTTAASTDDADDRVNKALNALAYLVIQDFRHAQTLRDFADAKHEGLLAAARTKRPEAYQGKFAVRLLEFLEQADGEQLVQGIVAIDHLSIPARIGSSTTIEQHEVRHGRDKWHNRDANGDTALHRLVRLGFGDAVNYLLLLGADPNVKSRDGSLPIHVAILEADWNTPLYLFRETWCGFEVRDGAGRSPFELAIMRKNPLLALIILLRLPKYVLERKDSKGKCRLFECVTELSPEANVATPHDAKKLLCELAIKDAERIVLDPVGRVEVLKQLAWLESELSTLAIELQLEQASVIPPVERIPIAEPGVWGADGTGKSYQIVPPAIRWIEKPKSDVGSSSKGLSVIRGSAQPKMIDPILIRKSEEIQEINAYIQRLRSFY